MNEKDTKIIGQLRRDARMPLTKMSRMTGIPVSTIFDRIQGSKVITKHTCLLDYTALGYMMRTSLVFAVDRKDREAMRKYLKHHEKVNSVFRINNGYDFLVDGIFKHAVEMNDFVEELEDKFSIKDKHSYYVIEEIKREGFLESFC